MSIIFNSSQQYSSKLLTRLFSWKSVLSILAIPAVLLLPPSVLFAEGVATFSISPDSGTYGVGKSFTVSVIADSPQGFNSANANLSFDPSQLSVSNISKTSSAFSLWAVEPSSDNAKGIVSFEGGNTTPLTGKKTLLSVTFKTLKEGKSIVSFSSGSILAADGKGTDILGTKSSATFDISVSAPSDSPTPPPPVQPVSSGIPKPDAPEITSPSHSDENTYYSAPKAKFTWDLPPDVVVVRLSLDTKDNTIPTTSYDPAISEKEFDQLTNGEMYFHIRYQNDSGWGATTHRKIKVDITPPEQFSLKVDVAASSSDAELTFTATDTLSGIDHYEVVVDSGTPIKVYESSLINGKYTLSAQAPGNHAVKVFAFDKAGNSTASEGNFSIEAIAKKIIEDTAPAPTDWRLIGDIILISLIAFLIGYLWYERSAFRHEKYLIKREADELRDNTTNVFAALREEVDEQAGMLFEKPNPSAKDREVLSEINEAIDLSEELLAKEVEDVRKLLA